MTHTEQLINGRYRVICRLGQGAAAEVFRAIDLTCGMTVAIKCVPSGNDDHARRMEQEIRALAQFDHPGLVRLLDAGVTSSHVYLVMELVDGPTLAEVLSTRALGLGETARVGAAVADALAYVHGRGVVHRDVKPANILMTSGGEARLADFGIALLLDAATLTLAGTTLGTPAYMAPEQIDDHRVGPPADVWALGAVLVECITGRAAFGGTPSEVLAQRLSRPVVLPSPLPARWQSLLGAMLDTRPGRRPSAAEITRRCAELMGEPDPTPTVVSPHRTESRHGGIPGIDVAAGIDDATRIVLDRTGRASDARRTARRRLSAPIAAVVVLTGVVVVLGSAGLGARDSGAPQGAVPRHATARPAATGTAPTGPVSDSTGGLSSLAAPATTRPELRRLVNDVLAGVQDGTVTADAATAITTPATAAVTAIDNGQQASANADLAQAQSAIDTGVGSGAIAAHIAPRLAGDLADLANALGTSPLQATVHGGTGPESGHHDGSSRGSQAGFGNGNGNGN